MWCMIFVLPACELARQPSETTKFGLPEARLGIFPGAGGVQRLARQIGKSKTMEMIFTGEMVCRHSKIMKAS